MGLKGGVNTLVGKVFTPMLVAAVMGVVLLVPVGPSYALQFDLDTVFNGSGPSGTGPWVTLVFSNVVAGTVQLDITLNLQAANEYVDEINFNFKPTENPTNLGIAYVSGVNFATFSTGTDAFQADGDGQFDAELTYTNGAFDNSDTARYNLTCALCSSTLDASFFNFQSTVQGANGIYFAAAQVTPGGNWVGATSSVNPLPPGQVPEPSSVLLLGLGLAELAQWRRLTQRKRSRQNVVAS